MKLAFCLFRYFPYGGLQRDFLHIAKECLRRGHSIDVYTMQWEGAEEPGLNVKMLPKKGLQNHTRIRNYINDLNQRFAETQYDLKIGFNKIPEMDVYFAADVCFKAKADRQRSFWYRLTPRYRYYVELEKAIFSPQSKTNILVLTQQQQNEFTQCYQSQAERFHLLSPGISKEHVVTTHYETLRTKVRKQFQLVEDDFLLLLVGSGFKTKGLDRILLGLASLPGHLKERTRLFVVGKDHAEQFQVQAAKLGITKQVVFFGGREDVTSFFAAADLLVHPAYSESAGMVLLEAQASGLPVLTTDVCGYAHYIAEGAGGTVLNSPFRQTEFNETLAAMLCPAKLYTWQKNAITFTQNANIYSMPQQAVNILESLGR